MFDLPIACICLAPVKVKLVLLQLFRRLKSLVTSTLQTEKYSTPIGSFVSQHVKLKHLHGVVAADAVWALKPFRLVSFTICLATKFFSTIFASFTGFGFWLSRLKLWVSAFPFFLSLFFFVASIAVDVIKVNITIFNVTVWLKFGLIFPRLNTTSRNCFFFWL